MDIELKGDYLAFGQFIDNLSELPILVNLSEIELSGSQKQKINFLGYLYFQSGNINDSLIAIRESLIFPD